MTTSFSQHPDWNSAPGWKNQLNNLRLLTQTLLLFNLIVPWLNIFSNEHLLPDFNDLIGTLNQVPLYFSTG